MKTCGKCSVDKLDSEYAIRNRFSGSLQPWCRECQKIYDGARNKTGHGKATAKRAQLKKLYGITLELYQKLLRAQGGVCAICGLIQANGRNLDVDHDHTTGEVRGLLCNPCNKALGFLRDDPARVQALARYLTLPTSSAIKESL